MAEGPSDNVQDLFKEEFKRYKKSAASDFIDLRTPERFSDEVGMVLLKSDQYKRGGGGI